MPLLELHLLPIRKGRRREKTKGIKKRIMRSRFLLQLTILNLLGSFAHSYNLIDWLLNTYNFLFGLRKIVKRPWFELGVISYFYLSLLPLQFQFQRRRDEEVLKVSRDEHGGKGCRDLFTLVPTSCFTATLPFPELLSCLPRLLCPWSSFSSSSRRSRGEGVSATEEQQHYYDSLGLLILWFFFFFHKSSKVMQDLNEAEMGRDARKW